MRLFLTGATGFVGRNLLLEALRSGRYSEIIAVVRDPEKLRCQLAKEGFFELSSLRIILWSDFQGHEVDHAVHCAGVLFARNREDYFRTNVEDTLRLLTPLPAATRTIVLSSQSAGGPTPIGKIARTSTDPDAPITWYGESKLLMEQALRAVRPEFYIWRPPMILGPRDRATLPLFQMVAGPLRIKPGLFPKTYSWIAVSDLVRAILSALDNPIEPNGVPLYVCAPGSITDLELIEMVGKIMGRKGWSMPIPYPIVRGLSTIVDAVPPLRNALPSLTRDRVREILANRWVIDGSEFHARFASTPLTCLRDTLAETYAWYVRSGLLLTPR